MKMFKEKWGSSSLRVIEELKHHPEQYQVNKIPNKLE